MVFPELENHLGIAEKSLAEFIVEIAKDKPSVKSFEQVRLRRSSSLLLSSAQCVEQLAVSYR